jgi:hypothetical protein
VLWVEHPSASCRSLLRLVRHLRSPWRSDVQLMSLQERTATHDNHTDNGVDLDPTLPSLLCRQPITIVSTDHQRIEKDSPVLAVILHLCHDAKPLPKLSTRLTEYSLPKLHRQSLSSTCSLLDRSSRIHGHKHLFIPSPHERMFLLHRVETGN